MRSVGLPPVMPATYHKLHLGKNCQSLFCRSNSTTTRDPRQIHARFTLTFALIVRGHAASDSVSALAWIGAGRAGCAQGITAGRVLSNATRKLWDEEGVAHHSYPYALQQVLHHALRHGKRVVLKLATEATVTRSLRFRVRNAYLTLLENLGRICRTQG